MPLTREQARQQLQQQLGREPTEEEIQQQIQASYGQATDPLAGVLSQVGQPQAPPQPTGFQQFQDAALQSGGYGNFPQAEGFLGVLQSLTAMPGAQEALAGLLAKGFGGSAGQAAQMVQQGRRGRLDQLNQQQQFGLQQEQLDLRRQAENRRSDFMEAQTSRIRQLTESDAKEEALTEAQLAAFGGSTYEDLTPYQQSLITRQEYKGIQKEAKNLDELGQLELEIKKLQAQGQAQNLDADRMNKASQILTRKLLASARNERFPEYSEMPDLVKEYYEPSDVEGLFRQTMSEIGTADLEQAELMSKIKYNVAQTARSKFLPLGSGGLVNIDSGQAIPPFGLTGEGAGAADGGKSNIPASNREKLADLKTTAELFKQVLDQYDENFVGPYQSRKHGIYEKFGMLSEQEVKFRAMVNYRLALQLNSLAGGALTPAEVERYLKGLPTLADPDETFKQKVEAIVGEIERRIKNRAEAFDADPSEFMPEDELIADGPNGEKLRWDEEKQEWVPVQ